MQECTVYTANRSSVDINAVTWHTSREQGPLPAATEEAFQAWLSADPRHRAAYLRVEQCMLTLRDLPDDRIVHLRAGGYAQGTARTTGLAATPARRRTAGLFGGWSRPSLAATALYCAVLVAIGMLWHQWRKPDFSGTYITQRGQRLDVALPDGTSLDLDADTRVEVSLYSDRRNVKLSHGQAMFSVAPDSSRPFVVFAGPSRISVVGTRFSVRYMKTGSDAGDVDVSVEEGHVKVADASFGLAHDSHAAFVDLHAGQRVLVFRSGNLSKVSTVPIKAVALWRKGLVHFENASLGDAIQEMERYGPTNLLVRSPEIAALRIGGSYQTARPDAFARVLPQILPVRLVPRTDGKTEIFPAR